MWRLWSRLVFISMHSSALIYTQGSNAGNVYFLRKGTGSYRSSKTLEKPNKLCTATKPDLCRLHYSRSLEECHQLWNQPSYNISSLNLQWSHQIKNWLSLDSRKSITRKTLCSFRSLCFEHWTGCYWIWQNAALGRNAQTFSVKPWSQQWMSNNKTKSFTQSVKFQSMTLWSRGRIVLHITLLNLWIIHKWIEMQNYNHKISTTVNNCMIYGLHLTFSITGCHLCDLHATAWQHNYTLRVA